MRRFLKYLAITLVSVVLLIALAAGGVYAWGGREAARVLPLPSHPFTAASDPASVARGEHFVKAIGKCAECHAADFGGAVGIDDPAIGYVWVPNLTRGRGGLPPTYGDLQFERAIRHGLAADGRRLVLMPSNEFQYISDEDLQAVIAYLNTLPPVDRDRVPMRLGPLARGLYFAGVFPLFPNAKVSHGEEAVATVAVDTTATYGKYLADIGCAGCHGETFGGGPIPGTPPDWPPPANLTPTGIGHYTYDTFTRAMREGMKAAGVPINPFMPIQATKQMTDVEIKAVWNYLRSLQPKEYGTR